MNKHYSNTILYLAFDDQRIHGDVMEATLFIVNRKCVFQHLCGCDVCTQCPRYLLPVVTDGIRSIAQYCIYSSSITKTIMGIDIENVKLTNL